jgi:hypothetical protein
MSREGGQSEEINPIAAASLAPTLAHGAEPRSLEALTNYHQDVQIRAETFKWSVLEILVPSPFGMLSQIPDVFVQPAWLGQNCQGRGLCSVLIPVTLPSVEWEGFGNSHPPYQGRDGEWEE